MAAFDAMGAGGKDAPCCPHINRKKWREKPDIRLRFCGFICFTAIFQEWSIVPTSICMEGKKTHCLESAIATATTSTGVGSRTVDTGKDEVNVGPWVGWTGISIWMSMTRWGGARRPTTRPGH